MVMRLDAIDWATLTRPQASRLIAAADARERALAKRFNAGEIEESEWLPALKLWEDLRVYALCGEKP